MQMGTMLCIDSDNVINRAFYAIPAMQAADGTPTNAIRGFCNTVLNLMEQTGGTQVICAFDGGVPPERKKAAPSYKANRKEKPQELAAQLEICRRIIAPALGWNTVHQPDTEADDILYTMAMRASEANRKLFIASGDKDIAQCLIFEGATLLRPPKKSSDPWDTLGPEDVNALFGVSPEQIPDLLALIGDSCDNLPGAKGVGPKTALKWILEHTSLRGILAARDKLEPRRLGAGLDEEALLKNLIVTKSYDTGHQLPEAKPPRCPKEMLKDLGLHRIAARLEKTKHKGQD